MLTRFSMVHWALIKANEFPDMLHRINKHELDKTAFHSHTNKKKKAMSSTDKDNIAQKPQLSFQKLYIEKNNPGLPGLSVQTTTVILYIYVKRCLLYQEMYSLLFY